MVKIKILAITLFIISAMPFFSLRIFAQEYQYEIGGMAGISSYMGDANKTALYKEPHIAAGFILRYNHNFRWAYKVNIAMGGVSGDTRKSGNVFPHSQNASFNRTFYEVGAQIEFNFFSYSDRYVYMGTKRFSPYVFTGIGATMGSGESTFLGMNIPLGIGMKYKLKNRLNLGFEFSFRKLFGDDFDKPNKKGFGLDDPYEIKSNFLKNKDWYSLTMFSITWDFGLKKDPCLNINY